MPAEETPRSVADVLAHGRWQGDPPETLKWLARLLRDEGVDLMSASCSDLERGTPVYVEADADVNEVQRRMALSHIRRVPVVENGHLLGLIDLLDLAMLDSEGETKRRAEESETVLDPQRETAEK